MPQVKGYQTDNKQLAKPDTTNDAILSKWLKDQLWGNTDINVIDTVWKIASKTKNPLTYEDLNQLASVVIIL